MYLKVLLFVIIQIGIFDIVKSVNTTEHSLLKSLNFSADEASPFRMNKETCKGYCSQTICTESSIKLVKHTAQYNWKIHGLRQYRSYLKSVDSKLYLISKVKFNSLSNEEASEWVFELTETEVDIQLSASTISKTIANQTIVEISMVGVVGNNSLRLPAQRASPKNKSGVYLSWKYFDVYVLNQLTDHQGEEIELHFIISLTIPNPDAQTKVECKTLQKHDLFISPVPPFLTNLANMMKDDKYADLVIKTGDEEFKVHRVILANSSPVFANLIFNKTFDKNESLLDLGAEIGSDIVEELIKYVYLGKIEDIDEIADRVIVGAHKYGFPQLKKICEEALIQQIKTENAFSMYFLATEVEAANLREKTFNLMKANKSKLVNQTEDFRKLSVHHPTIMFELFLSE